MIEIVNEMGVDASEYDYITGIMDYIKSEEDMLPGDYSLIATSFFGDNYAVKARLPFTKYKSIAFITGDEWNQRPSYLDDPNLALMFKTCVPSAGLHPKLLPLPLGTYRRFAPSYEYDIVERSFDVAFFGQVTCPQRQEMADAMTEYSNVVNKRVQTRSLYLEYTKKYANGPIGPYSEIMNDTKIALNPSPGNNVTVDSTRFFEGMAAGCVVISTRRPHTWFYDGAPYIAIDNWKEAPAIIEEVLNSQHYMEQMSRAAYDWWEKVCSPKAVGKYVIEKIRQI